MLEGLLGGIPVIGFIVSYLLNPSYIVSRPDGTPLLRLTKHPAFLKASSRSKKLNDIPEDDELRSLMALIMLVMLERRRG